MTDQERSARWRRIYSVLTTTTGDGSFAAEVAGNDRNCMIAVAALEQLNAELATARTRVLDLEQRARLHADAERRAAREKLVDEVYALIEDDASAVSTHSIVRAVIDIMERRSHVGEKEKGE